MRGHDKAICGKIRRVIKSCLNKEQLEMATVYCERLINKYDVDKLNRNILVTPRKVLKVNLFLKKKQFREEKRKQMDITQVASEANRFAVDSFKDFDIKYDGFKCPNCSSNTVHYTSFTWCPNLNCDFGTVPKVIFITKWCVK